MRTIITMNMNILIAYKALTSAGHAYVALTSACHAYIALTSACHIDNDIT